jgi:D-proline reductase (dithiol) PrdB
LTHDEEATYDEWFQRRRPLLDAKQWAEALRDVPRLTDLQPAAPRALSITLSQASVALVTSAGLTQDDQPPMDGANIEGDYTIRELDIDTSVSTLHIWHTHFDTAAALADINVVYPIDRLKELVAEGVIGQVATPAVSFMGYFSNVFRIRDETVPAVVTAVKRSGADAAVLVPV